MLRGRLAPRVAIITVAAAVVPLLGVTTASASAPAANPLQTGMTELAATYGTGAPDVFGDGAFGWTSAVAQSTVEAYEQATGDRRYVSDVAATYSEYVGSIHLASPISRTTILTTRAGGGLPGWRRT